VDHDHVPVFRARSSHNGLRGFSMNDVSERTPPLSTAGRPYQTRDHGDRPPFTRVALQVEVGPSLLCCRSYQAPVGFGCAFLSRRQLEPEAHRALPADRLLRLGVGASGEGLNVEEEASIWCGVRQRPSRLPFENKATVADASANGRLGRSPESGVSASSPPPLWGVPAPPRGGACALRCENTVILR